MAIYNITDPFLLPPPNDWYGADVCYTNKQDVRVRIIRRWPVKIDSKRKSIGEGILYERIRDSVWLKNDLYKMIIPKKMILDIVKYKSDNNIKSNTLQKYTTKEILVKQVVTYKNIKMGQWN